MATSTHLHTCPLCEAACGLEVTVDNGAVTRVRGDRTDVHSHGYLCPKATALRDLQDDPDRLRLPLVRRGGRHVEVSFEEAFAEIEARLPALRTTHGPFALGLVIGNPTVHRTGLVLAIQDLAAALGSPNVFSSATLDQMPKQVAVGHLFGDFYSIPVPDIDRTDLLVMLGANPAVSNASMWTLPDFRGRARALRARGGRLITIDPRRTETADLADEHLFIRPGTDALLLAAVTRTLFDESLVNLGPLAPLTSGVDEVRAALQPFIPEAVADRCGIPADGIRRLARDLATTPRAALYARLGACQQRHATVVNWLVDVINTLTGHLDQPGGVLFPCPPAFAPNTTGSAGTGPGITTGAYRSRVSGAPEVMNQFPLACLAEEIDTPGEGRIRGLVTVAANPVLSAPNGVRMAAALEQLDLMVSLDVYLNETTRFADVILPGPSPLEEPHYDVYFSLFGHRNTARYSPAVLPAPPGTPSDWATMLSLIGILSGRGPAADLDQLDDDLLRAKLSAQSDPDQAEMVMAALGPRRGPERVLDLALRTGPYGDGFGANPGGLSLDVVAAHPSGIDLGPLEPRLPEVLRTRSGTIELAHPDLLADLALAGGSLDERAPAPGLVLIGRRHLRSNNSWMHNLPVLAKGRDRCNLLVHPDDAARLGLSSGRSARLATVEGERSIETTVVCDDAMMPGVVSLPHGWGHDQPGTRLGVARARPGVNSNILADEHQRDPLSGNAVLNGIPVTLTPS